VEKDYHLRRLLSEVSKDDVLSKDLLFKGGTCLVKAYLGYYRFSEDVDFTWSKTKDLDGQSAKEINRICTGQVDLFLQRFKEITDELEMAFSGKKD
jgi:predicted nucleotidyltransferase component of viral defense system